MSSEKANLRALELGRAMTNLAAQNLATNSQRDLPAIVWTANLFMGLLGFLGPRSYLIARAFLQSSSEMSRSLVELKSALASR